MKTSNKNTKKSNAVAPINTNIDVTNVVESTPTPTERIEIVEVSKEEQLRDLLTNTDRDAVEAILTELGLIKVVAAATTAVSKSSLAEAILDEEYARTTIKQRKDILTRLMNECDMGPAYAGTKLQAYKTKHGLVNHR